MRISPQALERTLRAQLFNTPDGRYYMRGSASTPCNVYVEDPRVSFQQDRIWVHLHAHAKLGTSVAGACVGVPLGADADVSFVPEAQGESIGFRDARLEHLSSSKELNFLLIPFLSRKLPAQMKVNAAEMIRKLLVDSTRTTGYDLALDHLKLHSMLVEGQSLNVDLDASVSVH
ncbi:MAG TPA: hypothetical protein VGC07_08505 [Granulicella sp.]